MYIPNHFQLFELLSASYYKQFFPEYGNQLWAHFPSYTLWTLDALREKYGSIIINDWYWGGGIEYRGWRPFDCKWGAQLSFHKQYLAFDLDFQQESNQQVQSDIAQLYERETAFQFITCLEINTPHVHIDFRNHERLLQIKV